MEYKPPFTINDNIINLLAEISELVGQVSVLHKAGISPRLRRANRIKTIHSSLAIEHNSLSLEQVTAVLNGKRILGAPQEIKEVQNAYEAYELMLSLNPLNIEDLLKAHKLMMNIILDALTELDKSDQDADQVSDQVKALPECIDDELFAVQLMERLGLSHRPTFRKKYLHPALDMGLIEMTIPDKLNIRNQKYRRKT